MVINYKKVFRNQNVRFAILNALCFIPDRIMLGIQYYIKMGRRCNFKHPETWTEKLQLYKMYYRNPILGICVDKYEVRNYIARKGLQDILVTLYGVYSAPDKIDWNSFPKSFVVKTTNGGGGQNVILVRDKNQVDLSLIQDKLRFWLKRFAPGRNSLGREWAYSQIKKFRIIVEELLINPNNPSGGIEDFKILCFHGVPKYIIVDKDRYTDHRRNIYDTSWHRINVTTDHEQFSENYSKPYNLDEMLRVAGILSEDFPFVRVDLYNINGKIYFGELTFYPWSGYVKFFPKEFDRTLGELFDCSYFMP